MVLEQKSKLEILHKGRKIDKEDNKYQKDLKQKLKLKTQEEKATKENPKNKIQPLLSVLETHSFLDTIKLHPSAKSDVKPNI